MDDVAKRREARRRKILENSANRLNRITGIEQKSTWSPICENHPECSTDESPSNSNSTVNENIVNEVQPQQDVIREVKQPPKQYRTIVIGALAIFVNILLVIVEIFKFDANSTNINKIFLPLLVYEMIEFLSLHKYKTEQKSFIYLLLAANRKNEFLLAVIKYLQLFSSVLQDMMVYFFVFVCCDFVKYLLSR